MTNTAFVGRLVSMRWLAFSRPARGPEPLLWEFRAETTLRKQAARYPRGLLIAGLTLALNLFHLSAAPSAGRTDPAPPEALDAAVGWLQSRSSQMIRDCRRTTKSGITAFPPQVGGGYEAFWLRDYAYMLEGDREAFGDQELKDSYRFFLAGQRADGAMVDCIKFDGTPCYMPGYGTLGRNPVADGSQFMVDVAWHTFQKTRDTNLVTDTMEALIKGMKAVPLNPATGLVQIRPGAEHDRCPYGFTDAIRKQGDELFCSLLYVQASRQLRDLLEVANRKEEAAYWRIQAQQVSGKIREVFWDADSGLFRAATVVCNQPDIWGSAFAVYLDVATPVQAQTISRYFKEHYREIIKRGQLRHLPTGMFWEQTIGVKPGTYQNGAYWATPVGWFVYALDLTAPALADQTVVDLVRDFITTGDENECVNDGYANVSHYVASVALPLAGIRALQQRREARLPSARLKPDTFRHYVENFNRLDRETVATHIHNAAAWDWMAENIPLFECPDKDLEEIYYFRWWTYRKHIKQTPEGFIVTEFLPDVPWAGKDNSINCAAGHHFYEGRWLHNPQYLDDYARFWFRKGGEPRKYSFWAANSLYARSLVVGEFGLPKELLPDLIHNYEAWEKDHLDASGLFWQNDGNDGMEVSIGGSGCRATINSYQYGDALAIASIAELNGQPEIARTWCAKAASLKRLVEQKLWDPQGQFFKVLPRGKTTLADARELHGYTPWYFNLPGPDKSVAWKQLMDPRGFDAPFGPTTAEQRHPGFAVAYQGHECQWNGPSWPYATAVTLTAFANLLNQYSQDLVGKADYWKVFQCYLRSHRFRQIPPETRPAGAAPLESVETRQPWIDENLNPYNGDWIARTLLQQRRQAPAERGKDYNHSTFCDLVITGLVGLRPRADGILEVNPLVPEGIWDYFGLNRIRYHGRDITILYDQTGSRYALGKGLLVLADGKQIAHSEALRRITAPLP